MKIKRRDIHLISRHSNISSENVRKALQNNVYADAKDWHRFIQLLFASLGIGFSAAGLVFFFAYNWAAIHKFAKFGMIEAAIVIIAFIILATNIKLLFKNILLTGLAVLVGVMFAVFGQVYQTGADAYDFFLGWTLCITLWVLVANFAPLWLLYLTLVNTTFILYSHQIARGWSEIFVLSCLFFFNVLVLVAFIWSSKRYPRIQAPNWFIKLLSIASISFSTLSITIGIFDEFEGVWLSTLIISLIIYAIVVLYGLKWKSGFYIAIVCFSCIIIFSAFLITLTGDDEPVGMFFLVSLFIIASVTLVIKILLSLQKKWSHESAT